MCFIYSNQGDEIYSESPDGINKSLEKISQKSDESGSLYQPSTQSQTEIDSGSIFSSQDHGRVVETFSYFKKISL